MSGLKNAFQVLSENEVLEKAVKNEIPETTDINAPVFLNSSVSENEESQWIVQSSNKQRRLAPQFSLTKQDLGADNSRSKPNSNPHENVKKRGIF